MDDDELDPLACRLDGMSMPQLMRRKPPAHACAAQNRQRVAPYGSAVATPNTVWAATR
jgi:hypothetical protein